MDIPILYEDSEIVVIDKPSGVVCNRSETIKEETLQDWWDREYKDTRVQPSPDLGEGDTIQGLNPCIYFLERSGLVHRLDRETSGAMVMAKTVGAFVSLLKQFKEHSVQKEYLALTHGYWEAKEGEINLPLGRRRDDRKKFGVREDGRESVTHYEVVKEFRTWEFPREFKVDDRGYVGFSLVSFKPKTGRTHQIRVHAQKLGHPLVGDRDYAGRKRSREDRKWCKRVMLQADKLEFSHPGTGERVKFESRDAELKQTIQYFRN